MDLDDWKARWADGNTGWHEQAGNRFLRQWWPARADQSRVLVPLCGKALDLKWLAERGHEVVGVEISSVAVEAFFRENQIAYELDTAGAFQRYRSNDGRIQVYCGDYFEFDVGRFDALFDRAALIAMDAQARPAYLEHTKTLLKRHAARLVITLTYDQGLVTGPPFSVEAAEVRTAWPDLEPVLEVEAIDSVPPKFRAAKVQSVTELVWRSG